MRHIILSPVACLTVQYFSTLPHKRHDFQEKGKFLNIKYVTNNLMEYITLRLDSTNEVEQWYVRYNNFYCLIT